LGVARGRISRFPIDLRRRPYNTLALPCECVICIVDYVHQGGYVLSSVYLSVSNSHKNYRLDLRENSTTEMYLCHR